MQVPSQIRRLSKEELTERIPAGRRRSAELEMMLEGIERSLAISGNPLPPDGLCEEIRERRSAFTLNRSLRQARGAASERQIAGQETVTRLEKAWTERVRERGSRGARREVADTVGVSLATVDRFLRDRASRGLTQTAEFRSLQRATIKRLRIALTLERAYISALEARIALAGGILRASAFEKISSMLLNPSSPASPDPRSDGARSADFLC